MSRVFLSHSSTNKDYVKYIADKLGKDIAFYDEFSFEAGCKTFNEILKSLNESDMFVIFLSEDALKSEWVLKELDLSRELLKSNKLKQCFPIIIDSRLTYCDPRIPEWLRNGAGAYNLRYISSKKVAYRMIKNQLILLNKNDNYPNYSIYVGHEDLLKRFDNQYYTSQSSYKAIVAYGIEGIGRESFIRECIKVPKTFRDCYEPMVINIDKNDSIDVVISKLIDCGLGEDDAYPIDFINALSMDKKIEYLSFLFSQIQDLKEFVILRDSGAIVQQGSIVWWMIKALNGIRNELTLGIVSNYRVHKSIANSSIYIEEINELDTSGKLKLLDKLSKQNGLALDRDDIVFFKDIVTGYPLQIIFCIQKIKKESLAEVKQNSYEIVEFLSDSTIKIIDKYLGLLKYSEEKKTKLLAYLSFLASYANIPISEVLKINKLDSDYGDFYRDLISFCICRRTGLNNDLLTTSSSVVDYIERNGIKIPKDISISLRNEYNEFKSYLQANELDDYCYSQIEHNLKELVLDDEYQNNYKYIYPSIILKAVVLLYNKKSYDKVINICLNCLNAIGSWDPNIRQSFYFYYAMAVARKKDKSIFDIIYKKIGVTYILEKFQADFIRGFYYKLIGNYEEATKQLVSCLSNNNSYVRARRELVESYIQLEEYNLALDLSEKNYVKYPDNIFNIYQYFNCLIRENPIKIEKVEELLKKASEVNKLPTTSKQFYPIMKSLYHRFVKDDNDTALRILIENKVFFDNEIYFYRDIFDIYIEMNDVEKMSDSFENLKSAVDNDKSYYPLLFRRECVLYYYKHRNINDVYNKIDVAINIPSKTKERIKAYIRNLKV